MTWVKGQSGNMKGRPPAPEAEELRNALKKAKRKFGISLIDHCVQKAYENPKMAATILRKILPDLQHVEGQIDASVVVKVVNNFIDGGTPDAGNNDPA